MKKLQQIIFSLLAIVLVLQVSGAGILFAQDINNEEIIEVIEDQDKKEFNEEITDSFLEDEDQNIENPIQEDEEQEEQEEQEEPEEASEIALGDFKLTFRDYQGVNSSNAYIRTGESTLGIITFNLAGQEGVDANKLTFRLKFPKGSDVRMSDNTSYSLSIGSETSPTGTPSASDAYTYVWFTLRSPLNSAQTETINFEHKPHLTPGANGTDDVVITVEMDAFEIKENSFSKLNNEASASMISYADVFGFDSVRSTFSPTNQSVTTKTDGTLSTITFNQNVRHLNANNTSGLVYTSKIIYTNTFEVEKDSANNPFIKFKRNDIVKPDGSVFENTELSVVSNSSGYVTSFTIITEAVGNGSQQLSNTNAGFKINSSQLDKELVQNEFNLGIGSSKKVYITNTSSTAKAYPVSKVSGLAGNALDLTVAAIGSTGATYTNASETGTESYDQTFAKRLFSIADISTIGANMESLSAYKNDIVVYDYAIGWNNKQENKIDRLVISEYADHPEGIGYKSDEIRPLRIQTGAVSINRVSLEDATVGLDVVVEYTDGTPNFVTTLSAEELAKSKTVRIPTEKQEFVKSIKFVYTNVDPNLTITSAPKVEYRVVGGDSTKQGIKINNKVNLNYEYNTQEFEKQSNNVYFRFRDVEVDKDGLYHSNKNAENLTRTTFQEQNDVILFSLDIENRKNDDVEIKTIFDEFTYNLSPYDGLQVAYDDAEAELMDPNYVARDEDGNLLNPNNETNLVLWKYVVDPENPEAEPTLQRLDDQSAIETISFTKSVDTEYSTMTVTFADGALVLEPGEKVIVTYTMYTNERFETDATIGNRFEALDPMDELIGKGEYWKSKPIDDHTEPTTPTSYNKSGINASGTTLSERPFVGDIVIYTLTFENKLDTDWKNLVIHDTYSSNLSPYNSKAGISDELYNKYGLTEGLPLNIGVAKDAAGEFVMPEGFDVDQIEVNLDEASNSFTINLGNSVLKEGEKLQLTYTMTLNETASAKESIVNRFTLASMDEEVARGHHYWSAHDNATHGGIISNIKSVTGIRTDDGIMPDINRLVDGETLQYTVTLSNYLPRPNRSVHVKNIIDYMPKYITYVEDSFVLEYKTSVLQDDGETYITEIEAIDPDTYEMIYDEETNQIEVRFLTNYEQPGGIEGTNVNNPINSVIMTYVGLVDSTNTRFEPINPKDSRVDVTNRAVAFYEEELSSLVAKSGTLASKNENSPYKDNDPVTQSYSMSSTSVKVLNENNPFGWISKHVSDNNTIDVLGEDVTREYTIRAYNTAFRPFDVTHIVDLLPEYETVNENTPIMVVDHTNNVEYEAIYKLDTVTLEEATYNRLTVTGYLKDGVEEIISLEEIKLPGKNNSMSIIYETNIDTIKAREDLYKSDRYNKVVRNSAAMYTNEEIEIFSPQGENVTASYKREDDHVEESDWDSDETTNIRYETGVNATLFASAITPYMDIRAQIVEVSGTDGTTYRNALATDYINPGDIVGWKVRVGNSNVDNTPNIKAQTSIIMEVPDGLRFDGYSEDEIPSFLEEVNVNEDARVLIWKTTEDIKRNEIKEFIFRTTTRSAFYEVYTIDGYFVPYDLEEYGFFNSKVYASNEYRSYNNQERRRNFLFEPNYGELPSEFDLEDFKYHYLKGTESANVLGNLSIGGRMDVQSLVQTNKKATTTAAPYFITLNDVEDTVRFSMALDVYKVGAGVEDLVFINRLAGDNDRFVLRNQYRRSQGSLTLVDDGDFVVEKVNATSGSLIERLDDSLYSIQYAVEAYDYNFTANDWDHNNHDIWMSATELEDAGYTFADVTATRTIIDNAVALEMNQSVKVSYTAALKDYHNPTWEVYNSYAYGALVDGGTPIKAETRSLGIKSSIYADRLKLVTEVIDPALVPLRTDFDLEIIAYDKDTHEEVKTYTHTATVDDVNGILENISWIEELNRSHYFEVVAKAYEDFREPVVTLVSETDQYGLTTWQAHILYERIIYDEIDVEIEVNTINDKYPVTDVTYQLKEIDENDELVSTEDRIVSLANRNVFSGQDSITDKETGNTYEVVALDIPHYTYVIETIGIETLDTTGLKYSYKITYTQDKEKEIDDEDGKEEGEEDDKEDVKDKGSKKDPSTGIEDKTLIYVAILVIAVIGGFIVMKKSKKEDK